MTTSPQIIAIIGAVLLLAMWLTHYGWVEALWLIFVTAIISWMIADYAAPKLPKKGVA